MTASKPTDPKVWGPICQPIHTSVPGNLKGDSVFRDNCYATVWDPAQNAFLTVHMMSTPNRPEARMARASMSVDDSLVEIIEPLEQPQEPGITTFRSKSIQYDVCDSRIVVNAPGLSCDLQMTPLYTLIDWAATDVIPPAGGQEGSKSYEYLVDITGPCVIKGRKLQLSASGHRDRSIGFRDESVNWKEFIWFLGMFDDFAVSVLRFVASQNKFDRTDGFVISKNEMRKVHSIAVTRDPSGLFAEGSFGLDRGEELKIRSLGRQGGFWLPMGWERKGPAMSDYQEFCPMRTSDGVEGFGQVEHGILRELF